jgi:hypothetical protein
MEPTMRTLRTCLALVLSLGLAFSAVAPAQAGLIKGVAAKHKANPNTLHNKAKEKIKDHKAYSGHPGKRK